MEELQLNTFQDAKPQAAIASVSTSYFVKEVNQENGSLFESMLCDSSSRLIPHGLTRPDWADEYVMFINAGTEYSIQADPLEFMGDTYFQGGTILRTNELIAESGDYGCLYQSVRLGNFSYRIGSLLPGSYYVDLHFAEIISTNGPKGMRVFNVFIQQEKVLSDVDIFSVVGANKPLQVVDIRVSVQEDGVILTKFEGVIGSAMLSGICIRRAPNVSVPSSRKAYIKCNKCDAEMEVSSAQKKLIQSKAASNYEKKIQQLTVQCQQKTNECHEAWMSLTTASEQLEKVRMELDNKNFRTRSLDQTVEKQAETLGNIENMYMHDKNYWSLAIKDLQEKIKVMKEDHSQLSRQAHECSDSILDLSKMVAAVQTLVMECGDLKLKYSEEQAKRKELFNQIQEIKGNIRVFCRCRPLNKDEISAGCGIIVDFDFAKDGDLGIMTSSSTKKSYKFDRVFTPKDTQVNVFADALPLVISVLDGYNVCIFAYGQTGTGKTFTMEGTEQNRGVNYRTLAHLFDVANERRESFKYDISVSVLEVYNEHIRDLLAVSSTSKKLEIKQSSDGLLHHVPGLVEAKVNNIREVWNLLQAGSNARSVGSNNLNEHSSRSHCLLCIVVKTENFMNGECTKSKLWLVDLAGSERLARTDVQGERLKEAQNINRSLSALGDVIHALAMKSNHIPYRNSKLTHLLQDSLGGDSKTVMFVQISPSEKDMVETLSSLNFATRVRGVELGPARKQLDTSELQRMKAMFDRAKQESRSKDETLKKLEESIYNLDSKVRAKDQMLKSQQDKFKELESHLELKIVLHTQLEKQVSQLSETLKGSEENCSYLRQRVKDLEAKLSEQQQSESESFQQVRDLEEKLKEQVQESKSYSLVLQCKITELERKYQEQEQNPEIAVLRNKILNLEDKLKEHEQYSSLSSGCVDQMGLTPKVEEKTCIRDVDMIKDVEPCIILKSSNSVKRPTSQGSILPKGNSTNETARRRRESRSGESENVAVTTNMGRKCDPPKVVQVARTVAKPIMPTNNTKRILSHKRSNSNRDEVQGVKEKDSKKKMWSR